MPQTITDLWHGEIAPCEHCGSHDVQANHLQHLMERNREVLFSELSAAQKDTLQKYIDHSEEFLMRMLELAFYEGFSLASKLIAESLT